MAYPGAPPPKDVTEARRIINQALDNMSYDNIRILAMRIKNAAADVLMSGTSLNDDGCPFI